MLSNTLRKECGYKMKLKSGLHFFNQIIAICVIIILISANLLMVGASVISYAVELFETNSENIEFSAYFLNSNGEKVEEITETIDNDNIKLYMDISVKKEGYFNGTISFENCNFNLKKDNLSPQIAEISDDNVITLKQMNAEDKETIEVGIETKKEEEINVSLLNMKADVHLKGTYVNSKEDTRNRGKISSNCKLDIKHKNTSRIRSSNFNK